MTMYALILTTYMFGSFSKSPMAVAQTTTNGFTTEQACKNAGVSAQASAPELASGEQSVLIRYQCAAMSI